MTTKLQQKVSEFMDNFFYHQIKNGQMKFDFEDGWLSIYYQETLTAFGKDQKFSLLCAQSISDYSSISKRDGSINFHSMKLLDRIHTILFEALRSAKQDVNILLSERN